MKQKFFTFFVFLTLAFVHSQQSNAQCLTTSTPTNNCSFGDAIDAFSLAGVPTSGNYGCTSNITTGYSFFSTPVRSLTIGNSYAWSSTTGTSGSISYNEGFAIWIDLNGNGQYEASEQIVSDAASTTHSGTLTIPNTATPGTNVKMRTRCAYNSSIASTDACTNSIGFGFGETEDYFVNLTGGCATIVTAQPVNVTMCAPTGVSFSITATSAVSYQWQESQNGGGTWQNLTNTGVYSGTSTATLAISATSVPMNNYQYRCVAIGATCSATSSAAILSVPTPGVVSSTPGTACIGTSGSVSVVPTTGGVVNWYTAVTGGTLLASATNTYTVPSVASTATYYADVTQPPRTGTLTQTTGTTNGQNGACLDVKPLVGMSMTAFDFIPFNTATYASVSVYYKVGTYNGFETTPGAWTLVGTYTSLAGTAGVPITLTFPSALSLTAGQVYSFYVYAGQTITYWNGTTFGALWSSNADLETYQGKGITALFGAQIGSPRCIGGTFRYSVSNACTPAARTPVTLTALSTPAITGNPSNVAICVNGSTSFGASATGTGVGYQWQVNQGAGFVNVANGGVYSGATTTTLAITSAPVTMNGYQYRCVAAGTCSPAVNTTTATLTVNASPAITTPPTNTTACPLGNPTFSVVASNATTYQWQENQGAGFINLVNGGVYSNTGTATLNITGAPLSMNGYIYRCLVSGACAPAATSSPATLSINASIPITQQPQSSQICVGTNTSFSVVAAGAGILYQWQVDNGTGFVNLVNGGVYSGATTPTLAVTGPSTAFSGLVYRCIVSNPCVLPFATSNATLIVDASPAITTQPVSAVTVCQNVTTTLSVAATGGGLNYIWQVNQGAGFTNIPSAPPYIGMFSNTLTIGSPQPNLNGYIYRCVVSGNCAPAVTSTTSTLTVQGVPTIVTPPTQVVVCAGSNATFTVGATGTGLTYQWQENSTTGYNNISNGGIYSGATSASLTIASAPATMNGTDYRCIIAGVCSPTVTTTPVSLVVNTTPTITSQPKDAVVCAGSNTNITLFATAQTTSPMIFQWQVNDGTGFTNLINGAPYGGVTTNNLSITNAALLQNGYTFRCILTSNCAPSVTSNVVKLIVNTLPAVTSHPSDVTLCPQSIATFTVAGVGTGLQYRWQVNNGTGYVNLTDNATYNGVGGASLKVLTAATMNNYLFRCVLSGYCAPTVISNAARLNVLNPVVIAYYTPTDTVCEGGNTRFNVNALGVSLRYQWQRKLANGNYIDLNDIPPYAGVNTDGLRITGAPDSISGYIYRCRVYETVLCGLSFYTGDIPLVMNLAPVTSPIQSIKGPLTIDTFTVPSGGSVYQWQEDNNNGAGFRDLTNNATYQGVNTFRLIISPVVQTMNGNKYRCIVDGICKTQVASKYATLLVDPLGVATAKAGTFGLNIYPNPLEGTKLNISFSKSLKGATEVRVLDKLGKLVYTQELDFSKNTASSIELNGLAAGVYMLQVVNQTENVTESVRFTKQ